MVLKIALNWEKCKLRQRMVLVRLKVRSMDRLLCTVRLQVLVVSLVCLWTNVPLLVTRGRSLSKQKRRVDPK